MWRYYFGIVVGGVVTCHKDSIGVKAATDTHPCSLGCVRPRRPAAIGALPPLVRGAGGLVQRVVCIGPVGSPAASDTNISETHKVKRPGVSFVWWIHLFFG